MALISFYSELPVLQLLVESNILCEVLKFNQNCLILKDVRIRTDVCMCVFIVPGFLSEAVMFLSTLLIFHLCDLSAFSA